MNILYIGILLCLIAIYFYAKRRDKKRKNDLLNKQRLLNPVKKVSKTKTDRYRVRECEDLEDFGDFEFPKELIFKGVYDSLDKAEKGEGYIAIVGDVEFVCVRGKWIEFGKLYEP